MIAICSKLLRVPIVLLWQRQARVSLGVGHRLMAGREIWGNQEDVRVKREPIGGL